MAQTEQRPGRDWASAWQSWEELTGFQGPRSPAVVSGCLCWTGPVGWAGTEKHMVWGTEALGNNRKLKTSVSPVMLQVPEGGARGLRTRAGLHLLGWVQTDPRVRKTWLWSKASLPRNLEHERNLVSWGAELLVLPRGDRPGPGVWCG